MSMKTIGYTVLGGGILGAIGLITGVATGTYLGMDEEAMEAIKAAVDNRDLQPMQDALNALKNNQVFQDAVNANVAGKGGEANIIAEMMSADSVAQRLSDMHTYLPALTADMMAGLTPQQIEAYNGFITGGGFGPEASRVLGEAIAAGAKGAAIGGGAGVLGGGVIGYNMASNSEAEEGNWADYVRNREHQAAMPLPPR